MTSAAPHSKHQRARQAAALVRLMSSWLLVAVLAVDLIASPLHTHRHDGEWSPAGALWAAADHADGRHGPGEVHAPMQVDHDDAPGLSHSISALRGHAKGMADAPPAQEAAAALPGFFAAQGLPAATAACFIWPPDRPRAGSGAFRSLPPDGRAPPRHA